MPPKALPPGQAQAQSIPNQTLYIQNLSTKEKKVDLKRSLYLLFTTYGSVLDIVAPRSEKMRGQAHVVFKDTTSSTKAMQALQNYDFLGREMRISYAKGESNIISSLKGVAKAETKTAPSQGTTLQKSVFGIAPGTAKSDTTVAGSKRVRDEQTENGDGKGDDKRDDDGDEDMEMDMSDSD